MAIAQPLQSRRPSRRPAAGCSATSLVKSVSTPFGISPPERTQIPRISSSSVLPPNNANYYHQAVPKNWQELPVRAMLDQPSRTSIVPEALHKPSISKKRSFVEETTVDAISKRLTTGEHRRYDRRYTREGMGEEAIQMYDMSLWVFYLGSRRKDKEICVL